MDGPAPRPDPDERASTRRNQKASRTAGSPRAAAPEGDDGLGGEEQNQQSRAGADFKEPPEDFHNLALAQASIVNAGPGPRRRFSQPGGNYIPHWRYLRVRGRLVTAGAPDYVRFRRDTPLPPPFQRNTPNEKGAAQKVLGNVSAMNGRFSTEATDVLLVRSSPLKNR